MKIINYSVSNFRCLSGSVEDNRINFDNSNTIFLFGNNNVGKSTYLRSYEFYYYKTLPTIGDFFEQRAGTEMIFELELLLDSIDYERIELHAPGKIDSFKKKWILDDKLKVRRKYLLDEDKKISKEINFTLKNDSSDWDCPSDADWGTVGYGGIGLPNVFRPLLPKPIFIKAMPTEKDVEDIVNGILSDKAAKALEQKEREELKAAQRVIKELQEKMYNPNEIHQYKKSVNRYYEKLFPDLNIELVEEDKVKWTENKFGKKYSVVFNPKVKLEDGSVPNSFNSIGHGAIRTAIFTLLIMQDIAEGVERIEQRKDYLVLFEEPELFLHPKLIKDLRRLIYRVSEDDLPYQVLCASHSPQMIDISKPKSSIVRMAVDCGSTSIFQINETFLTEAKSINKKDLKHVMYEVLRFNPYICESFYADEVLLVEGPTEEVIIRGYLSEGAATKDLFVVNCGSVTNIPFYQKVFHKFCICYHVICDTDDAKILRHDESGNPIFDSGIQKTISDLHQNHFSNKNINTGLLRYHVATFEPAHNDKTIPENIRLDSIKPKESDGKPYNANLYWKKVISPKIKDCDIQKLPIIRNLNEILDFAGKQ